MKKTIGLAFILALFSTRGANAQPWMDQLSARGQTNFYDIQSAFNRYWQGKDYKEKGKGWKPFKRWEWFWEPRVYPTGELPDPMQLYDEYVKVMGARGRNANINGGNWTELGPSSAAGGYSGVGRINCVRVDPINSSILWAGSPSGGLWKSTNAGGSWSTVTDELPSLGVTDIVIDPTNTNVMYIATGDGDAGDTYSVGVLKSTDGGTTWNPTGLNWATSQARTISRLMMHPSNPAILIAAGSGIYLTTNGGTTWTQTQSSTHRDLEFKPGNPSIVYAAGSSGVIRRSTDGGSTWTTLTSGLPTSGIGRVALGVSPANAEYVYALFSNSSNSGFYGLYKSVDSGVSWTLTANTPNLLGWASDGSDVGGQGWYDLAVAVSQTDPKTLYTGGVNNWKSTDGGISWTSISSWTSNVHADQHDLYFMPGTNTMYVGNDGGVYRTTNGGSSWSWIGNGVKTTQFYRLGVSATNAGRIMAGAQDNGTKYLNNGTWYDVIGGDGMDCLVDYSNANVMYGTIYYGDIYKTTNAWASSTVISGSIADTGAWVTPYVQHPTSPTTLFAGYKNVWKTTNGGTNWQKVSFGGTASLDVIAVAPSDPQVIYTATYNTLRHTTDGGTTWSSMATPSGAGAITSLAIKPTNASTIWVTSSGYSAGYKVWKSTNGGTSWTNVSGTLPNVPTNAIVYEAGSQDRVYVGTDIGVYYRDLNTTDWQDFNTGLPNVVVSDLEIQYSSGKLRAATYGRGIWESPLAANGTAVLSSTPDSITVTLVQGDSTTRTLHMTNNGTAALNWNIQTTAPGIVPPAKTHNLQPKGARDVRVGNPVLDGSGGPDAFGYRWIDSDEPGGPAYSWVDISGIGTAITTGQWIPSGTYSGTDDGYYPVLLPFTFTYYGVACDTVFVSTNGNVRLVRPAAVDYANAAIPVNDDVNDVLAPFWDDMNLTTSGTVYYYYDAPHSRFIIQYANVPPYSGTGSYTFEVMLKSNGGILFQYSSMTAALNSATIGIEDGSGTDGLLVAFNGVYMHDALAIEFLNSNWMSVNPSSGTIQPTNSQNVTVTLWATEAPGSAQHANILLYSNDPLANPRTVPVTVNVSATTQTLSVPMAGGWNIISVPLSLSNYTTTAVFPTAVSQAFGYSGNGYEVRDTLQNGPGYWLKFPLPQDVPMTGVSIASDTVDASAGWNLIGSVSQPIPATAVDPIGTSFQSPFFGYGPLGYVTADTLRPGVGYWIKVSTAGQLILRPVARALPVLGPATRAPTKKTAR